MLRSSRVVLMVLVAMFVVAVPTAVAQTPVADQYAGPVPIDDGLPTDQGGSAPVEDSQAQGDAGGSAPVEVTNVTGARSAGGIGAGAGAGALPFTGAQISLIALIGLGLLTLGAVGMAASRGRGPSTVS